MLMMLAFVLFFSLSCLVLHLLSHNIFLSPIFSGTFWSFIINRMFYILSLISAFNRCCFKKIHQKGYPSMSSCNLWMFQCMGRHKPLTLLIICLPGVLVFLFISSFLILGRACICNSYGQACAHAHTHIRGIVSAFVICLRNNCLVQSHSSCHCVFTLFLCCYCMLLEFILALNVVVLIILP